jgi:cell division protein FtsL
MRNKNFLTVTIVFHITLLTQLVLQSGDVEQELQTLHNRIAELEEEKGNLQLSLVDFDEMKGKLNAVRFIDLIFNAMSTCSV